jgi:hypothetical protein
LWPFGDILWPFGDILWPFGDILWPYGDTLWPYGDILWPFSDILWPFGDILWPSGIFFPILVCCTKKNLATLVGSTLSLRKLQRESVVDSWTFEG